MPPSDHVKAYLSCGAAEQRLALLRGMRHEEILLPLSLVRDLMHASLSNHEHIELLRTTDTQDRNAFENLLTRGFATWEPNVAAKALRLWAKKTDCLLWHRTIPLARDLQISQRLSYTLLDLAWYGEGGQLIENFSKLTGLEAMSPAFLALMFNRALQWSYKDEQLKNIGSRLLTNMDDINFKSDRAIPQVLAYFLRFFPEYFNQSDWHNNAFSIWGDIVRSALVSNLDREAVNKLDKLLTKSGKKLPKPEAIFQAWPSIWNRQHLTADIISKALDLLARHDLTTLPDGRLIFELFGGVPGAVLFAAVRALDDTKSLCHAVSILGNLLSDAQQATIIDALKQRLAADRDPATLLAQMPQRLRIRLSGSNQAGVFGRIFEEQQRFLTARDFTDPAKLCSFNPEPEMSDEDRQRYQFIRVKIGAEKQAKTDDSSFWGELCRAWLSKDEARLETLAQLARKAEPIFQSFYIETLGRFVGVDRAALKLLDFVRTGELDIVRAVISALANIDTQRSIQEVVAFLTRPNVTFEMQMEIAQILHTKDLSGLQSEIRSAIDDLHIDPHAEDQQFELRASLRDLIQISLVKPPVIGIAQPKVTSEELDGLLSHKIATYYKLSSETKRALRTAMFFHHQVSSAGDLSTIDLSPAIDMQYKALELAFREHFEAPCNHIINSGTLQRKLDVIGYARPIPAAMDEFETYIENLPIIKTIPFFSRFKLRKMLRALCQYRKGKRFTLDGLKAFGLFFICFGRKRCRYGLENQLLLDNVPDEDLAEFVKTLHIFQDFRNRAAHEGFHPDASNDLDSIWEHTTKIIDFMFVLLESFRLPGNDYHAAKASKDPVIIRKSS